MVNSCMVSARRDLAVTWSCADVVRNGCINDVVACRVVCVKLADLLYASVVVLYSRETDPYCRWYKWAFKTFLRGFSIACCAELCTSYGRDVRPFIACWLGVKMTQLGSQNFHLLIVWICEKHSSTVAHRQIWKSSHGDVKMMQIGSSNICRWRLRKPGKQKTWLDYMSNRIWRVWPVQWGCSG